jgi:hypothetical protein
MLVGCKKEPATPIVPPSKMDLLTRRPWREVGHTVSSPFGTNRKAFTGGNVYDGRPACWHDDFLQFKPDYSLLLDEGAMTCAPGDPQQRVDRWSFRPGSNESQLIMAFARPFSPYSDVYDIVELSETTLTIKQAQSSIQGQVVEEICYSAI